MKTVQFILCFLICLCIAAAAMVALLWGIVYALIPAAAGVAAAAALFFVMRVRRNAERESDSPARERRSKQARPVRKQMRTRDDA